MKKIFTLLSASLLVALIITSCTKKEETDDRDAFVGTWNLSETYTIPGWGSGTDNYAITISKSPVNDNGVIITNFGNVGLTVEGTVNGTSMSIPSQNVTYEGEIVSLSGSGSIAGSTLILNYTIVDYWTANCNGTKL